jgi:hypothetical protein
LDDLFDARRRSLIILETIPFPKLDNSVLRTSIEP